MVVGKEELPSDMLPLAIRNAHPRDSRIKFEEHTHTYTLDKIFKFPISVSGVWAKFFGVFDPSATVATYFTKWSSDPVSKYFSVIQDMRRSGHDDDEIKTRIMWRDAGQLARQAGTEMHRVIELLLNDVPCEIKTPELGQFCMFMREFISPRRWVPYRTEWSIYDDTHLIAGQVDCIFQDSDTGELHMVDWKRSAKSLSPKDGERFGRRGAPPCQFLVDNAFSHYAAQQNLYSTILRDHYGLCVTSMWLAQFHPNQHSYLVHRVPHFIPAARTMLVLCDARASSEGDASSSSRAVAVPLADKGQIH